MRRGVFRKMDWVGVIGVLLLLWGTPGYLAEERETRELAGWQDFVLPPPRIGDHVVFDLVVQVSVEDPVRVPAVMEVTHRAPVDGEIPAKASFVHEVRFRAVHADVGVGVYQREGSVHREYFNETSVLVWKQQERMGDWHDERAAVEEVFRPARLNERPWLTSAPGWAIAYRGDFAATFEQVLLERSPMLYDLWESRMRDSHDEVRDRLRYENETVYGGKADPYWELLGQDAPVKPCLQMATASDVPSFVPPAFEGESGSAVSTATSNDEGEFVFLPDGLPLSEHLRLRLGPHMFDVQLDEDIRLCQVGTDHAWYHPDVPVVAGDHLARGRVDQEDWVLTLDLVPSQIVRGGGAILHLEPDERQDPFTFTPPSRPAIDPTTYYTAPELPLAGPTMPLATLQDHDVSFAGGLSLAELHRLVRGAALPDVEALLAAGATLSGFVVDQGDPAGTPHWVLLYATASGTHIAVEVALPPDSEPQVRGLDCSESVHDATRLSRRFYTCPPATLVPDPAQVVVDPVWLFDQATKQLGHPPHAFSYEPLSGIGADWHEVFSPLGLLYDFANTLTPGGVGRAVAGVAQYSDDHVDPHDAASERHTEGIERGIFDLRDGVHLWSRTQIDDQTFITPATAGGAGSVFLYQREPIPDMTLATGGAALVLVAVLWRLLAGLKVGAVYPTVTALYARIAKDKVLAHGRREELMRLLEADPGLVPSDIESTLGWGWGATIHHLETLRRNGKVVRMQVGRMQHYFPLSVPNKAVRLRHVVRRRDEMVRFLDLVESSPGISLKELSAQCALSLPGLSKIGSKLVAYGLVRKEKDGKLTRFFPTMEGMDLSATQTGSLEAEGVGARA